MILAGSAMTASRSPKQGALRDIGFSVQRASGRTRDEAGDPRRLLFQARDQCEPKGFPLQRHLLQLHPDDLVAAVASPSIKNSCLMGPICSSTLRGLATKSRYAETSGSARPLFVRGRRCDPGASIQHRVVAGLPKMPDVRRRTFRWRAESASRRRALSPRRLHGQARRPDGNDWT